MEMHNDHRAQDQSHSHHATPPSVHVISMYEARSTGFAVQAGSASVSLSVTGEDTRPLILVLTSYYPIRWSLSIPSGVVVDKVIVVRAS